MVVIGGLLYGLTLALGASAHEPQWGIAAQLARGACAAIAGAPVTPGTPVTLVTVGAAQRMFYARVKEALAACAPLERALVPGPYYALEDIPENGMTMAVVAVDKIPAVISNGRVKLQPDDGGDTLSVSICASQEGVHITVWSGEPRAGRRVWHVYWYLGYDIEPSCAASEIAS